MDDVGTLIVVGVLVVAAMVGLLLASQEAVPVPASDTVIVPYVDAGRDQTVEEGASTRLTSQGYDHQGGKVSFHWDADRGRFDDPNKLLPIYTAPLISSCSESVTLKLTVTNEQGLSATDTVIVQVRSQFWCSPAHIPYFYRGALVNETPFSLPCRPGNMVPVACSCPTIGDYKPGLVPRDMRWEFRTSLGANLC
jgi:hypothetical protein